MSKASQSIDGKKILQKSNFLESIDRYELRVVLVANSHLIYHTGNVVFDIRGRSKTKIYLQKKIHFKSLRLRIPFCTLINYAMCSLANNGSHRQNSFLVSLVSSDDGGRVANSTKAKYSFKRNPSFLFNFAKILFFFLNLK